MKVRSISAFTLLMALCFVVAARPAAAIHINLTRATVGSNLLGYTTVAGNTSNFKIGNGQTGTIAQYTAVLNQAKAYWEQIFPNQSDYTINIKWGLAPLPDAYGYTGDTVVSNNRTVSASIVFDSIDPHYVDTSLTTATEFGAVHRTTYNEGAGFISDQFWYGPGPSGTDQGSYKDLMTVAMHEIGHAIGLNPSQNSATNGGSNTVIVTSPRPFPGTWAAIDGWHITDGFNYTLMMGGTGGSTLGVRIFPSSYDILTIAQLSNLTPNSSWIKTTPIPEPTTYAILACGFVLLPLVRRTRGR